jgi:imidazoleglycerol-phosphate dehydratase
MQTSESVALERKVVFEGMAMSRTAHVQRKTQETQIAVEINLDGKGRTKVETGIGFFDHMLTHIGRHGLFDLTVEATGDLHIDLHHTVEDVGICLGTAIDQALADKTGIYRYGHASVPMDEALADIAIDLSGRPSLVYNVNFPGSKIGQFDTELVREFARAFANHARMNLHVNVPYGFNNHHIAEAISKAMGRALRQAVGIDARETEIPSTKGSL